MSALERRPAAGQVQRPVLEARVLPPAWDRTRLETWTDQRYALLTRVRKAAARGEIREAGRWSQVPGLSGWYSVEVYRLKDPVPAWKRAAPWVLGGLVALAGVVAAVGYLLAALFAGLAAIPVWAWVLAAVLLFGGGGGTVTVITKVIVRR